MPRALSVLLLACLLSVGANGASDSSADYGTCAPYCIVFDQIGDKHYAVALNTSGRYLGLTAFQNDWAGALAHRARLLPVRIGEPQLASLAETALGPSLGVTPHYAVGCGGSIVARAEIVDSAETDTHIIGVVKTTFTCNSDGSVLHAEHTIVRFRKP